MREDTIRRKKASRSLKGVQGGEWPAGRVAQFLSQGKVIVSSVLNLATENPNCPRRRCASPRSRTSTSYQRKRTGSVPLAEEARSLRSSQVSPENLPLECG